MPKPEAKTLIAPAPLPSLPEDVGRVESFRACGDSGPRSSVDKDTLSIVIVSWNTSEFLLKCLRSIVSGTQGQRLEVIVVDNGSTDGSQEAVRREFPHVCLIQNESNLGFAKANNIGLERATGQYVCLINSDVEIFEGCLDRMRSYMDQHPSIGMLGPRILNADSTLQRSCRQFPTLWNSFCRTLVLDRIFAKLPVFGGNLMTYWPHNRIGQVDVLSGCFWMLRHEVLGSVGLLDDGFFIYGEDVDFCKRCRLKGWEIVFFPEAEAVHYGGASSSRFPVRFAVENLKARARYWKKHHSRPAQALFLLIRFLLHVRRLLAGLALYLLKPAQKHRSLTEIKVNFACILWLLHIPVPQMT